MANLTIYTPLSAEENKALRERLNDALAPLGYYSKPGPRGKGDGGGLGYFLLDLADGGTAAFKIDDALHPAFAPWLNARIAELEAQVSDDDILEVLYALRDALADAFQRRHNQD